MLGPLSAEDDREIRGIFDQVDTILLDIASHFGRETAGWQGTGLELNLVASGQVSISGYVSASNAKGNCVDFGLELLPSWYHGKRSEKLTWEVEIEVFADCQHWIDHGHMETVHRKTVHLDTPLTAARVLLESALELASLAKDFPIEHWLRLASDDATNSSSTEQR